MPPSRKDSARAEDGVGADWPERPTALFVLLAVSVLFLLRLGSYGLWDPWESHYAEVSREILERGDAIRLHWQREWFWSKPVLLFWLQAISMRLFGVNRGGPTEMVDSFLPEWALRLPVGLISVAGLYALYAVFAPRIGRRAAALGTVASATASQVVFIARQGITDMLFLGLVALAIAAYVKSLDVADDAPAPRYPFFQDRDGKPLLELGLNQIAIGVVLLLALPQIVLIAQTLYRPVGVRLLAPTIGGGWPVMAPFLLALAGFVAAAGWRLDRAREAWLYLAYAAAGAAVLGKGLPGIALPLAILVVYGAITGELKRELNGRALGVHALGLFAVAGPIAAPWFVAMHICFPHGFVNEFFGMHHWRRLTGGAHHTVEGGFDYYVPWLSYGLFPWTGLGVASLFRIRSGRAAQPRGEPIVAAAGEAPGSAGSPIGSAGSPGARASLANAELLDRRSRLLLAVWALVAFVLFSATKTKYNHYILPAVLPLAFLGGLLLDDVWRGRASPWLLAVGLGIYLVVAYRLYQEPARLVWLFVYNYKRPFPRDLDYRPLIARLTVLGAIPLAGLCTVSLARLGPGLRRGAALATLGFAGLWALFCGQKYQVELARHWTQKELIARYFAERGQDAQGRPERLVAWQMNWRGETFYTKNTEVPFVSLNNTAVSRYFARQPPNTRLFVIFEKGRLRTLKSLLGPTAGGRIELLTDLENNKFYLGTTVLNRPAQRP